MRRFRGASSIPTTCMRDFQKVLLIFGHNSPASRIEKIHFYLYPYICPMCSMDRHESAIVITHAA
ncbi:hypothetical protein BDV24DRAFT_90542 [Aspergillus arachidicola]|uniref:Uncharacterized protein n=1 Tax=Aspergillus arachidicola TaxID=656916 RepID=A0A5N6YM53_9EURO|nr:hypothetical protein BDV24DRAFT_90542 [Aspergillus arachidicola]